MTLVSLLLLTCSALPGTLPAAEGTISGTVSDRSLGRNCPCRTTVLLRAQAEGQFVPFRETVSDAEGRFRFEGLPVGEGWRYLIGANQDEIHYPGPRITLTANRPHVSAELVVYGAATQPNPLVIRRYEITVCPEPGALRVTESLVLENPSSTCYVGKPPAKGAEPVTLQLAVPADFERATFDQEFFGRRFYMLGDKLTTGVPWPPGRRELKLTYVLPNAQGRRLWERPVDLPCAEVRLRVRTAKPEEITCDLPADSAASGTEEVVFRSAGQVPAGHIIRVALGRLSVPWMNYARWAAVGTLAAVLAAAGAAVVRRRGRAAAVAEGPHIAPSCH